MPTHLTVFAYSSTQNLFFFFLVINTMCKKATWPQSKAFTIKYYFPNAVSNRDEIGNNFYEDNKTLCVEVNG